MDFEWYLELCPNYYKAAYYLIKMHMNKDDGKCRALLLQLPRKNQPNQKLRLFDIHRQHHLFKVCKCILFIQEVKTRILRKNIFLNRQKSGFFH